jgi:hypothetical protein
MLLLRNASFLAKLGLVRVRPPGSGS